MTWNIRKFKIVFQVEVGCLMDNVVCSGEGGAKWISEHWLFRCTDPTDSGRFLTCKDKFDWIMKEWQPLGTWYYLFFAHI